MSKMIERIGALLAKAEATDNEHERDAYYAKAQSLATTHSIDLAVARRKQAKAEQREQPVVEDVWFGSLGTRNTKKSLVLLFSTIADTQDLRMNIRHDSTGVILFGMPSDIEVAEALFESLSVVMVREADKYLRRGDYKNETVYRAKRVKNDGWWGPATEEVWGHWPVDGRTARINFYDGFRSAIGARLRRAKREAEAKVAEQEYEIQVDGAGEGVTEVTTGELVLRSKREEVRDFYSKKSTARGSWSGVSRGSSASGARSAGRDAGNRAGLGGGTAVGGGRAALAR
jgi:hypothetical protein